MTIVVVGAGPTGLTLACALRHRGVACRVIERSPAATGRSRAIGVSARSLEILDELGAADALVARGLPSRQAVFYSNRRPVGRLTASHVNGTRFPYLLAVPQSATEAVLEARLGELGGRVERGRAVVEVLPAGDGPVNVRIAGSDASGATEDVSVDWLIGADGADSAVRQQAGVDVVTDAGGLVFANVDARLSNPPTPGVGHYYFSTQGLLVIAPLPGDVFRVTASLHGSETSGALTRDDVETIISRRASPDIGVLGLDDAGWGVSRVRIQTHIASAFRAGRILLAGDAAHTYGPMGAQGMNGGIQDAWALAWRLALVATGRSRPQILDGYAQERRTVARTTLHHVGLQTRMATLQARPAVAVRDAMVRGFTQVGLIDRLMGPRINQFDLSYAAPDRSIAGVLRRRPDPVGRRLPDVALDVLGQKTSTTLHQALRQRTPTPLLVALVVAPVTAAPSVDAFTAYVGDHWSPELALCVVWSGAGGRADGLVDGTGELGRSLGHRDEPWVWLIRPDHHIAYGSSLGDAAALDAAVTLLVPGSTSPVSADSALPVR